MDFNFIFVFRKTLVVKKKKALFFKKALLTERKRNAVLAKKLNRSRLNNLALEKSLQTCEDNHDFLPGHSTLRTDQSKLNESSLQTSMNNLSLASLNIPECKPVMDEEDIDKKSFEEWKDLLEASMELVAVTEEHVKMSVFKIKAGSKLLDILNSTASVEGIPDPNTNPYSNAISRLNNYFGSRDYTLMQRQKLRSLTQRADESDTKYVNRIIAAAKLCDFSNEQLCENVAFTIQSHAGNVKIREICRKVLRKGESVVYLLNKVRAVEIERVNEELYTKNHQQVKQIAAIAANRESQQSSKPQYRKTVNVIPSRQQRTFGNKQNFRRRGRYLQNGFTRTSSINRNRCWRCSSLFHNPENCHCIEKICRNCHQKGHIQRACRAEEATKRKYPESNEPTASKIRKIATVSKEEYNDDYATEVVSEMHSE